jgi:GNAT superfamily N-acetyltransferase
MPLRVAVESDLNTVIELIRGLAEYEREPDSVTLDREELRRHLFGPHPYAEVLLAETDAGESAGFALFFHNFSTWTGKPGIYLEDLFVRPEHRSKGFGRALLQEIAVIAITRGCGRVEWSVLDWNAPSIAFYGSLGARPMDEWTTYRLDGEALDRLAATPPHQRGRST